MFPLAQRESEFDEFTLFRIAGNTGFFEKGSGHVVAEPNRLTVTDALADPASGETRQLTNAKKSSDAPAFSPDGKRLAFASDRGEKRRVFLIDPRGGEAEALTTAEDGVSAFAWSPDGSAIAFTAEDPKGDSFKEREKKGGEYEVVGQDHRMTHLHVIELASKKTRRGPSELQVATDSAPVNPATWLRAQTARIVPRDRLHDAPGPLLACLDADLTPGPLLVRARRPGGRFRTLGGAGSRKVKSFLIDRKVPVDERGRIPLVLSGDRIAWVVGHQIDDRFKMTPATRRVLVLEKET